MEKKQKKLTAAEAVVVVRIGQAHEEPIRVAIEEEKAGLASANDARLRLCVLLASAKADIESRAEVEGRKIRGAFRHWVQSRLRGKLTVSPAMRYAKVGALASAKERRSAFEQMKSRDALSAEKYRARQKAAREAAKAAQVASPETPKTSETPVTSAGQSDAGRESRASSAEVPATRESLVDSVRGAVRALALSGALGTPAERLSSARQLLAELMDELSPDGELHRLALRPAPDVAVASKRVAKRPATRQQKEVSDRAVA